jgi:hypothetical protein
MTNKPKHLLFTGVVVTFIVSITKCKPKTKKIMMLKFKKIEVSFKTDKKKGLTIKISSKTCFALLAYYFSSHGHHTHKQEYFISCGVLDRIEGGKQETSNTGTFVCMLRLRRCSSWM